VSKRKSTKFQPGQSGNPAGRPVGNKLDDSPIDTVTIRLTCKGNQTEMPKEDTQFKPGNLGGPGRPLGSKNRLSEYFLTELAYHFEEHGREAIERVFDDRPGEYLRIIAALIPRELLLEVSTGEKPQFVINAQPLLTTLEWQKMHGLTKIEERLILAIYL